MAAPHGLNDAALLYITNMIREGLRTEGREQVRELLQSETNPLKTKTEELLISLDKYYKEKVESMDGESKKMQTVIEEQFKLKEEQIAASTERQQSLEEQLDIKERQITALLEELRKWQGEMTEVKRNIDLVKDETQKLLGDGAGSWRKAIENQIQSGHNATSEVANQVSGISNRTGTIEQ